MGLSVEQLREHLVVAIEQRDQVALVLDDMRVEAKRLRAELDRRDGVDLFVATEQRDRAQLERDALRAEAERLRVELEQAQGEMQALRCKCGRLRAVLKRTRRDMHTQWEVLRDTREDLEEEVVHLLRAVSVMMEMPCPAGALEADRRRLIEQISAAVQGRDLEEIRASLSSARNA